MTIPTVTTGASPSIVDLVGNTPLIRLRRIERELQGVELYAKAEWQNLVPATAKKGDVFPLPARVAERLLRFHLVDNTRGEPNFWRPDEVRRQRLTLTVEEAMAKKLRLRLEGTALLATAEKIGAPLTLVTIAIGLLAL